MNLEPQMAAAAARPTADLATTGDRETADLPAAAGPPGATAKGIVYGLLWLAIPLVVLVVWVMAAASADPTGGCGGG